MKNIAAIKNARIIFALRIILFLALFCSITYSQSIYVREGYLARYDLATDSITVFYNIPSCWDGRADTNSYYTSVISYKDRIYPILIKKYEIPSSMQSDFYVADVLNSTAHYFACIPPSIHPLVGERGYLYPVEVQNGMWIFNDYFGRVFIDETGEINVLQESGERDLIHLAGKIDSLYFTVVTTNPYYESEFYLTIEDNYPDFTVTEETEISLPEETKIDKLVNLKGDLYLYTSPLEHKLSLALYSDFKLELIKNLIEEEIYGFNEWKYEDNKLYLVYSDRIDEYNFSETDTSFIFSKVFLEGEFMLDKYFRYCAKNVEDTIYVYNLADGELIKKIDFTKVLYHEKIMVDYPYIYFNKLEKIYDVNEPNIAARGYRLLQNYPNPFNASTAISFSIPKSGEVRIVLFDVLGRKIDIILEGYKTVGEHSIKYNASNLNSGVYFYQLTSGDFKETRKLLLLK